MLSGVALLLGTMLVAAGFPKLAAPRYVASALRRALTAGNDATLLLAGRLLGGWELLLGAALVAVTGRAGIAVAALAAVTFAGFTTFVVLAIRRGAACGCWASLSEGPAGGAELARALALTALAVVLLAGRAMTPPSGGPPGSASLDWAALGRDAVRWDAVGWGPLAWAGGALAVTWIATVAGGRLHPVSNGRIRRRLLVQDAPHRLGRTAARLATLAGFVHAGTDAGRRRYAAARQAAGRVSRSWSTIPLPPATPLPPAAPLPQTTPQPAATPLPAPEGVLEPAAHTALPDGAADAR